ncbi:uncharacterized protein LOC107485747 [Arachis duranensis]|uniref:Uncharacterized protein LOC107485747 n=1 Tax=Arachis duranensis TaxID=130453 RepID=A0A9C6TUB5_ARADU|nr:uncharacterized protein LOC107485747 [Arachis duranensis]
MQSEMGELYALDFDGILCDSCGESSLSALKAAKVRWPSLFHGVDSATQDWIVDQMHSSRFADALLRELAGVTIPPERIYGLGTGPKVEVLKQLQKRPKHQGLTLHFVEDRLATLKNVIKEPELDQWNLYLGNWGYNTQKEREEAAAIPRIQVLELSDFSKKLK